MKDYSQLKGKSKAEIIELLGDQFNHYPSHLWTYILGRNWLGRKKELVIVFYQDRVLIATLRWRW